jgi:hypothetical protein
MPKRRKVMQKTVYNLQKGRLETIDIAFTDENTTWFDEGCHDHDIRMITDFEGGLLISPAGYDYPLWIDGASRAAIDHNIESASALKASVSSVTE